MYGYDIMHTEIAENLIDNVRSGRTQHAYIFEGEQGVGNLAAAQLFANALVCERTPDAPCTMCPACIMAKAGTHPDIVSLRTKDGKKNITVDQIRKLTSDAYVKPFESKSKVYLICEDMNEQAQNAFLKVLEEPPEYAVFIIITENNETLLQTIRSRCALIHFAPVSDKIIREYIQHRFPEEEKRLDFLVRYSQGVAGNAEKIIARENFMQLRNDAFSMLSKLLSDRAVDAYDVSDFIEENKDDADLILQFWLDFVRDIMLAQNGAKKLAANTDLLTEIARFADSADEGRIVRAAEQLIMAQKMRKRYVGLRILALRLAFSIKYKA